MCLTQFAELLTHRAEGDHFCPETMAPSSTVYRSTVQQPAHINSPLTSSATG